MGLFAFAPISIKALNYNIDADLQMGGNDILGLGDAVSATQTMAMNLESTFLSSIASANTKTSFDGEYYGDDATPAYYTFKIPPRYAVGSTFQYSCDIHSTNPFTARLQFYVGIIQNVLLPNLLLFTITTVSTAYETKTSDFIIPISGCYLVTRLTATSATGYIKNQKIKGDDVSATLTWA